MFDVGLDKVVIVVGTVMDVVVVVGKEANGTRRGSPSLYAGCHDPPSGVASNHPPYVAFFVRRRNDHVAAVFLPDFFLFFLFLPSQVLRRTRLHQRHTCLP